ncbi:transposase [Streptomyces sp. NPDC001817]|uniref:IS110 family transposase n=1 Tax=Streptomyces sp. NPDC001817 TaxID=3154398 RepID=UPI003317EE8E
MGIDPHKHVHVAVAVDADGRRLTKPLTVKDDANLIGVLLKLIRTIADGTPITWAIEDGRGFARRLADNLLLTGHEVVWVPTRLMAAHRKLHAATTRGLTKRMPSSCGQGAGRCEGRHRNPVSTHQWGRSADTYREFHSP